MTHRREHLTPEQVARFEELTKQIEQGDIPEEMIQVRLCSSVCMCECMCVVTRPTMVMMWKKYHTVHHYPLLPLPQTSPVGKTTSRHHLTSMSYQYSETCL